MGVDPIGEADIGVGDGPGRELPRPQVESLLFELTQLHGEREIGHPCAVQVSQEVEVPPKSSRPANPESLHPVDRWAPQGEEQMGKVPDVIRVVVGIEYPVQYVQACPGPHELAQGTAAAVQEEHLVADLYQEAGRGPLSAGNGRPRSEHGYPHTGFPLGSGACIPYHYHRLQFGSIRGLR